MSKKKVDSTIEEVGGAAFFPEIGRLPGGFPGSKLPDRHGTGNPEALGVMAADPEKCKAGFHVFQSFGHDPDLPEAGRQ